MPHGILGPVTLRRHTGRFTMLVNDANPASVKPWPNEPWEPSLWKPQTVDFSASRCRGKGCDFDVTLGQQYGGCVLNRLGVGLQSSVDCGGGVGFTPP
jgi:hypothetical protein